VAERHPKEIAMSRTTAGIHHVTAIASDPQRNLDFYAGTLGLRLVKRTVNFDDPGTYHFYYGDRTGRPGTLLTFFPWPGARPGRDGAGQAVRTSFAVPAGSLGFWKDRLTTAGVPGLVGREIFGEPALQFADPDGMALELVEDRHSAESDVTAHDAVPGDAAIRRIQGSLLQLRDAGMTSALLTDVLGLVPAGKEGDRARFIPASGVGGGVDLVTQAAATAGSMGAGTVHHVAWRAADSAEQAALRAGVVDAGLQPTPVIDRQYFRSIYFREPGGVLFEIATDDPGFLIDEPEATLGESLKLPPQYESQRSRIERALPALLVPAR
jgi:glyoxalase family protein